jgi:hypothetical protein
MQNENKNAYTMRIKIKSKRLAPRQLLAASHRWQPSSGTLPWWWRRAAGANVVVEETDAVVEGIDAMVEEDLPQMP